MTPLPPEPAPLHGDEVVCRCGHRCADHGGECWGYVDGSAFCPCRGYIPLDMVRDVGGAA